MRKLGALAALAVVTLPGCARLATPDPTPLPADLLFLRTARSVTVVSPLSDAPALQLPGAVPSTDWSTVVQGVRDDGQTEVIAREAASGSTLWTRHVPGRFEVKVASRDGRFVALGPPRENTAYPAGRSSTTLVVLDREATEPRQIELDGNYEPEAFSTDGTSLFVIEYLPPTDPDSYRVRRLDLVSDEVVGVYTVDEELQERMRGTARIQAASPDGRRLYTLYTIDAADGTTHSFVHVLSLDELWAHCVDLPANLARSEQAMALSVSPDGRRLYVADAVGDAVAEIDTESLAVTRVGHVVFGSNGNRAHAVSAPNGMLYVAGGEGVVAVDAATLVREDAWDMGDRITGLQVGSEGDRLYVGLRERIAIIDTVSGENLDFLDPDDVGTIDQLGESTRTYVEEEQQRVLCAC